MAGKRKYKPLIIEKPAVVMTVMCEGAKKVLEDDSCILGIAETDEQVEYIKEIIEKAYQAGYKAGHYDGRCDEED